MKSLGDIKCFFEESAFIRGEQKSHNLVLAWEEYLVLREVQRKPMGLHTESENLLPLEATLLLRAQKLLDPTRNKQSPSASSHVL